MKRNRHGFSVSCDTQKLLSVAKVLTAISAACAAVWFVAHHQERRCRK